VSVDGEGTTMRVSLPMFVGAVKRADEAAEPRDGGILLVEDDADCREVLQELLEQEGYPISAASSGAEARALLATGRPAMVLLDLRLSDEDGTAILHTIRQSPELRDVVVYIISGASDVAQIAAGTGIDRVDGFFEKPLQLQKLLQTVASVVRPAVSAADKPATPKA
jgi:CheY-like chemotaxis protein